MINSYRSLCWPTDAGALRTVSRYAALAMALVVAVQPASAAEPASRFEWKTIERGFSFAKYELGNPNSVIRPEVFLLKFDLKNFDFQPAIATGTAGDGFTGDNVRNLTKLAGGIAGINANFFDQKGQPLGLVMIDNFTKHKIQRGGGVLTGVFFMRRGEAGIEHRDSFKDKDVTTAVQGGPRLVEDGKPIQLSTEDESSRRTGVAINKKGEVILYATVLRFPGASLRDIQTMLIDPQLEITHALNLDGGGSSQLFVESFPSLQGETLITGGDNVPVALVAKRKQ